MRKNLAVRAAPLIVPLLLTAGEVVAQDAAAILETALERYEERVRGIDDYTVTYSFMGQSSSTHLEKRMIDGSPVFVAVGEYGESGRAWSAYREFPKLAARAKLAGTERIDGRQAHGLRVDDFEGLDLDVPVEGEFEPRALTMWIDSSEYLVRKMKVEGVLAAEGEERPFEMTARLQDYRTVEGMPHPFRTTIQIKGAMSGGGASEAELAEARQQLEEFDRQMAEMPASQRQMVEQMMGGQIEQLRKMVAAEGLEMELVVTDLQVNTGQAGGS